MQYMNEIIVKTLKLRTSRICTRDVDNLRAQILEKTIFSAFSERDLVSIWARLQTMNDLIFFLYVLFENVNYLKTLIACMTRLIRSSFDDTIFIALFKVFFNINQRVDRVVI